MNSTNILDVYLHGRLAGKLSQEKSGILSFVYDEGYANDKKEMPLSVSMPLLHDIYLDSIARPFFSGLLPDDIVRTRLAEYLGISEKNPFALLTEIGGECAGAVALYQTGEKPPSGVAVAPEILDEKKLRDILELLKRRPMLAGQDDLRLSLAGAQDKIAVGVIDGKIALFKGGAPTSHILKPMIERVHDSAQNELFCLSLAARLGLPAAKASMGFAGDAPYLLVERYDRALENGARVRLHQEDFCQALSIAPEKKYEREGGPDIADCLRLIDRCSARPAVDRLAFLHLVIFNYLIGNSDCHGKNFSLLYRPEGPRLAPAYDLMCTAVYPDVQKKLAMKIGGEYDPEKIFRRHWHRLVADTAGARKAIDKDLNDMARAIGAEAATLADQFRDQGIASTIVGSIREIIEKRVRQVTEEF
jgi:serine/threonine-protein kinase HipA